MDFIGKSFPIQIPLYIVALKPIKGVMITRKPVELAIFITEAKQMPGDVFLLRGETKTENDFCESDTIECVSITDQLLFKVWASEKGMGAIGAPEKIFRK
jgi:hypothetical protein